VFKLLGQEIVASIAQSVEAAVSGSDGFGQAMEKILKSALASLTGVAVVHVAKEFAEAASDLATIGMEWHAGLHFKAAAEWAAVGAAAGIGGALIPGGSGGGGGSGSGGGKASITQNASTQAGAQPTPSINVAKLGSGGLVTHQTLALLGDDEGGGGDQEELVLPLGSSRAQQAIDRLFGGRGGGPGETHNHYYINGLQFTTNDMTTLSRRLTRASQTGRVRVSVANASRVTRKS